MNAIPYTAPATVSALVKDLVSAFLVVAGSLVAVIGIAKSLPLLALAGAFTALGAGIYQVIKVRREAQ